MQTSTAQLLLCIEAVDSVAAAAEEEENRRARSTGSSRSGRTVSPGGARDGPGLRLPDAMAARRRRVRGSCRSPVGNLGDEGKGGPTVASIAWTGRRLLITLQIDYRAYTLRI